LTILDERLDEREGFELEEVKEAFETGLLSLNLDERSIYDIAL
jgi:hypothetical protein